MVEKLHSHKVSWKQDIGLFEKLREKLTTHLSTEHQQTSKP